MWREFGDGSGKQNWDLSAWWTSRAVKPYFSLNFHKLEKSPLLFERFRKRRWSDAAPERLEYEQPERHTPMIAVKPGSLGVAGKTVLRVCGEDPRASTLTALPVVLDRCKSVLAAAKCGRTTGAGDPKSGVG